MKQPGKGWTKVMLSRADGCKANDLQIANNTVACCDRADQLPRNGSATPAFFPGMAGPWK